MKDLFKVAIIFTIIVLVSGLALASLVQQVIKANEDIEICKELGYDGGTTKPFSTQIECANFTELERYKRENRE